MNGEFHHVWHGQYIRGLIKSFNSWALGSVKCAAEGEFMVKPQSGQTKGNKTLQRCPQAWLTGRADST